MVTLHAVLNSFTGYAAALAATVYVRFSERLEGDVETGE